jgi:hypothetical protein
MKRANPAALTPELLERQVGTRAAGFTVGQPFNPYRRFYGSFIPEQVSRFKGLSPGAKIVYGRLCRYAGKDGKVYPSMPTLGLEIGIGSKQVRRYVRELENGGFVRSEPEAGKVSHYVFLWHSAYQGETGAVRKGGRPLPKTRVPENGSTTPPENGTPVNGRQRESDSLRGSQEESQSDYQRTNRKYRDSHADGSARPSEPKKTITEQERAWMADALARYGDPTQMRRVMGEEPPAAIVQKCLEAADGVPREDIWNLLRHRSLHGFKPGTAKGPKKWAWFVAVIDRAVKEWREQELASKKPVGNWTDYAASVDPDLERGMEAF